jgi:hypothetical protein
MKEIKMKNYVLGAILIVIVTTVSLPLLRAEERDSSAVLEEARRAMHFQQVAVTEVEGGATSLDGVYFFLCKGRFPNTVDGVLVARNSTLRETVNLAVNDAKGNVLLSCPLGAEPERDFSIFFFTLNKEFVTEATLQLFPQGRMSELRLSKVTQRTQTVLELGDLVEMISKEEKTNANK